MEIGGRATATLRVVNYKNNNSLFTIIYDLVDFMLVGVIIPEQ
jgi:hypothetical protein